MLVFPFFVCFLIVAIIFSFLVAEKEKSPHLLVDCCCLLKQVKCTLINCTLGDPTMYHLTPWYVLGEISQELPSHHFCRLLLVKCIFPIQKFCLLSCFKNEIVCDRLIIQRQFTMYKPCVHNLLSDILDLWWHNT